MKKKKPGNAVELLNIASRLSGLMEKAEKAEVWKAKCLDQCRVLLEEIGNGKGDNAPLLMLRAAQMLREGDAISDDKALALFHWCFVHIKDEEYPDHPDMKSKLEEITAGIDLNTKEGVHAHGRAWLRCKFASLMRHMGEHETAKLIMNHPEIINQRLKDGYTEWTKNDPEIKPLGKSFFEAMYLYL